MLDSGTDQEILTIKKYLAQLFLQLQLLMGFKSKYIRVAGETECQAVRGKEAGEESLCTCVTDWAGEALGLIGEARCICRKEVNCCVELLSCGRWR